jgi:aspartyl-tRNA(Asn)/glutamyl-tRNA(Gln) amidotransferase subunit C
MSLSLVEVESIAALARLELSEEEKNLYREQLSAILDYFTHLQSLEIPETLPSAAVTPVGSPLREDVPGESLPRQVLLQNASEVESNQFRVPAVME